MAKYKMRVNAESFVYEKCKGNFGCDIDPLKTLIEGYKVLVMDNFENCLKAKWSIGDCIVGCHNPYYSATESSRRNSHQRRLSKELIAKLAEELEKADDFPNLPSDFESIYGWVGKHVESVRKTVGNEVDNNYDSNQEEVAETFEELSIHICPLLKYDTALRMSYNLAAPDGGFIPREKNNYLPQKYVYLQRGALWGAKALAEITRLSKKESTLTPKRSKFVEKDYLQLDDIKELENPTRIEISQFCSDLQALGSYHVENFLCIYHRILEDWASGYEIRICKLEKSKKIINN